MTTDERLEEISDRIRSGQPVGIVEAIQAIEYQAKLRGEREANRLHKRIWRWIRGVNRRSK